MSWKDDWWFPTVPRRHWCYLLYADIHALILDFEEDELAGEAMVNLYTMAMSFHTQGDLLLPIDSTDAVYPRVRVGSANGLYVEMDLQGLQGEEFFHSFRMGSTIGRFGHVVSRHKLSGKWVRNLKWIDDSEVHDLVSKIAYELRLGNG